MQVESWAPAKPAPLRCYTVPMTGRTLTILVVIVLIGAGIGVYLIKQTPTAFSDEPQVRATVAAFGKRLQIVSLLGPKEHVAAAMQSAYGSYIAPQLLTEWLNDPLHAPGRRTSSPWPDHIDIKSVTKVGETKYDVQGEIVDVDNEGGGIGEMPTEAARRAVAMRLERSGDAWRITALTLGSYPGDGEWMYSEPDSHGIQFLYLKTLPTAFISAQDWPPKVTLVSETFSCTDGERKNTDGLLAKYEQHTVGDRVYCVTKETKGAARSTYITYEYTTTQGDFVAHVVFTLRFPQCMNYNEPRQSACKTEQASYDIDGLVDRIASSIRMQ